MSAQSPQLDGERAISLGRSLRSRKPAPANQLTPNPFVGDLQAFLERRLRLPAQPLPEARVVAVAPAHTSEPTHPLQRRHALRRRKVKKRASTKEVTAKTARKYMGT